MNNNTYTYSDVINKNQWEYSNRNTAVDFGGEYPQDNEPLKEEEGFGTVEIKTTLPKDLAAYIEKTALREIVDDIKRSVKRAIFKKKYRGSYYGSSSASEELDEWVMNYVKEVIAENKDEIIHQAAIQLADHMRRSKLVREKFGDMMEEELAGE